MRFSLTASFRNEDKRQCQVTLLRDIRNVWGGTSAAGNPAAKTKVFLVDDHPIVRQGLRLLINREAGPDGLRRSGRRSRSTAGDCQRLQPDLIGLDISLDGPDGLEILKTIRMKDAHSAGSGSVHA